MTKCETERNNEKSGKNKREKRKEKERKQIKIAAGLHHARSFIANLYATEEAKKQ